VAPAKEIPCNECSNSFSSLQNYMEHHCPNGRLPTGGRKEGEDDEGMVDDSDVENLCSDIIYQPDGSAFILEDAKEQRGNQGVLSGSLQVSSSQSGLSPGGERLDQPAAPMSFYPPLINTFHIASSLGSKSLAPDHPSFQNTSVGGMAGAGPVLHSFRVYDLRHKNDKDYLTADGAAKNSCVSKDVPNNVDLSKFEGCVADGRRKPVLMCFLCKLSFGYSRSFVTHAVHDHRMTLTEAEQKLLSNKHVSAIIQGIGKDKEPLISFLEPKKPLNSGLSHFPTSANFLGPDTGLRGLWNAFHSSGENAESLQAGFAFLKGSASSSSSDQNPRTQTMPKAETNPNLGG
uniref:Zinc finger homeobox 4 n=1 Tax=Tetraodon nigroviridis TaxID=99883 RepID=H3BZI6_TETNG